MHLTDNRLFGNIRSSYRRLRITSACLAVSVLGGCFQSELVTQGIAYNQALADTHNKLILLNAVRAAYRYPMYFSDTGPLVARAQDEVSLGLDYNFGADAPDSHTVKPSLKLLGGATTMNFNNLNREEFTNKVIFKEAKLKTLNFYISNGWNPDLIYLLLVSGFRADPDKLHKMEIITADYCALSNNDEFKKARCRDFMRIFSGVDKNGIYLGETRAETVLIRNSGGNYRTFQYVINMFVILDGGIENIKKGEKKIKKRVERGKLSYEYQDDMEIAIAFDNPYASRRAKNEKIGEKLKIYLRSPQAIIYYVGEVIRRQLEGKQTPEIPVGAPKEIGPDEFHLDKAPLIVVRKGAGHSPAIRVQHAGQSFHVPQPDLSKGDEHRTLQVFALINQLLTLATSKDAIPQPSTVVFAQ